MKLLLATAIAAALAAGLFLVPIAGHTLWQRAESRGLPRSAARAMSSGAHAAVRWVETKEPQPGAPDNMPGHKTAHHEVARAAQPNAHTQLPDARVRSVPAAPSAAERDSTPAASAPEHALRIPPKAAPAHDHIVAAPPEEELSAGDRQGLDKLIAGAGHSAH